MRTLILTLFFLAAGAYATEPNYTLGHKNPDIAAGARALLAGRDEEGIQLTLKGLEAANDKKEEEIALSNLCAGDTNLGDYDTALRYCEIVEQRNDELWRVHASKALIYLHRKDYVKAEEALLRGEALNPGAHSLKVARALFLDATQPVVPEIEVDDRRPQSR